MEPDNTPLQQLYNTLWQDALDYFAMGRVEIDPHLTDPRTDHRIGMTLIARPEPQVVERFSGFLREMALIEPDQYYYQPGDFHVTILSPFTATENFEPYAARIPTYLELFAPILATVKPFTIDFQGVTASKSSVMAQGFPRDGQIERLREALRYALRRNGWGQDLDRRYRIRTAHSTLLRFKTPPRDLPRMVDALSCYRDYDFGASYTHKLALVKSNWYMSANTLEILAEYPLL